jgi:hypothetical protein
MVIACALLIIALKAIDDTIKALNLSIDIPNSSNPASAYNPAGLVSRSDKTGNDRLGLPSAN